MKKIPTIYQRNSVNRALVTDIPTPGCEWVFRKEGVATRKYDGTCCLIKYGRFYKRREVKPNKKLPENFIQEDYDPITKKTVGWVPVDFANPADPWHIQAYKALIEDPLQRETIDGTYELLGPKINGNPEHMKDHILLKHSEAQQILPYPPLQDLHTWFKDLDIDIEGVVFHHPDGRMAKIKKRDYGLTRNILAE